MSAFNVFASLLSVLAVALPFLFARTQAPLSNFWPLMVAGGCAWLLAALAWVRAGQGAGRGQAASSTQPAVALAAGLLLGAVVGACIGLLQFFRGDLGWAPWVYPASIGEALGNLRQRNQQATLMALGLWALVWWVGRAAACTQGQPLLPGGRVRTGRVSDWLVRLSGFLTPWALVPIAACAAATASRTGALEWGVLLVLLILWRRSMGWLPLGLAGAGVLLYLGAAWALPHLLEQWTGVAMDGLFDRLGGGERCGTRSVLWPNMLHLIAQKPWAGWGWGELDYAHYATLFPGERFCVLVDNAHNLPLHLAVELGLPVALVFCGAVLWWVLRGRPWAETDPLRQLAWGVLAVIGVHSLLEFPLWYGPFQLATGLALWVLWRPHLPALGPALRAAVAVAGLAVLAWGAWLAHDYERVSGLYRPAPQRAPQYQRDTAEQVARETTFFRDAAAFAWVTTTPVTAANAATLYPAARRLLHYSPEPRIIEAVLASTRLLGLVDEEAFHAERYRIAYPRDYAAWARSAAAPSGPPASPQKRATSSM